MPLDLERIQAICFDVDGTLSDTDDLWVSRFEKGISWLRFAFPRRDVRPFARWTMMSIESPGTLVYHVLDHLDLDDEVGRLYNWMARRDMARSQANFWIIPQVRESLVRLQGRFPLSVVSARGKAGTLSFLRQYQLDPLFQSVATALTCRHTKPFPDPILWAAEQMGVSAHNVLMVGDTTVDIQAGKAAGAQTVGVLCGFGQEAELRRAGADLILPSTHLLADVLLGQAPTSPEE